MPPVVAVKATVDPAVADAISKALITMHLYTTGKKILEAAGYKKYVQVQDSHYDDLREIYSSLSLSKEAKGS